MRNICLTFCFILSAQMCFGQLELTPSYMNMPSMNNPASLGVNNKEGITASIYSRKSFHEGSSRSPKFREIVIDNDFFYDRNGVSGSSNAKNMYFLGYHKTFDIKESIAITAGAQTQLRQVTDLSLTSPQTYGFTINSHFLLKSKRFKERYFSNGIQVVLHHFKANKPILDLLYNEHLIEKPATFEELRAEISNFTLMTAYILIENEIPKLSPSLVFKGSFTANFH